MPLNRALVGKSYPPIITEVTLEALQKYACACNDHNRRYFEQSADDIVAPPMFSAVVTWLALITAISDPELRVDLLRLLHRAQDMEFFVPIRPNDRVSAVASIASIESSGGTEIIKIALEASNQHRELVSRTCFTALIRGRRERDGSSRQGHEQNMAEGEPVLTVSQKIDADQTIRYAEASGDRNPIHVDDAVARMAGLPGIIVHGLCTMGLVAGAIVNNLCAGYPVRLRRLGVGFSRPVFPGDTIITTVWSEGPRHGAMRFAYETCNQSGVAVLRDGIAEISAEGALH